MRILSTIFLFSFMFSSWAQQFGSIEGKVVDAQNKMELIGATIALYQNGVLKKGASVDFFGKYSIKPLDPGTYDVEVRYLGYKPQRRSGVLVSVNQATIINFALKSAINIAGGEDTVVEVTFYRKKLIDPTSTQEVLTSEEIQALPTQNQNDMVSLTGKMFQKDDGESVNASGARSNSNVTYIDGVKVIGSANIPKDAINQIAVINGGVPAMFGDATGAIINITTKGISYKTYGGVEFQTSQYLDPYGSNLFSGFLGGPLIWKKETKANPIGEGNFRTADGNSDSLFRIRPLLGYMLSAQGVYKLDKDPSGIDLWRVKESIVDSLSLSPYKKASLGTGVEKKSYYLTKDDMEQIKIKPNNDRRALSVSGKLDFALTQDINLTFGGSGNYYSDNHYNQRMFLVSSRNNAHRDRLSYRTFGRFSQSLFSDQKPEDQKDESFWMSNIFYSIQMDYSYDKFQYYNKNHKYNIFDYNHMGKFATTRAPVFVLGADSLTGSTAWLMQGYEDTKFEYEAGTLNPVLSNYVTNYYELSDQMPSSLTDVQIGNGILNGDDPGVLYSLYQDVGYQTAYYEFRENEQYRLSLLGNVDLNFRGKGERKDSLYTHALTLGLEYEQRIERDYEAHPYRNMWSLMRQLTNRHILGLDLENPLTVAGPNYDTIYYNRKYVAEDQSTFDYNLRKALGLNVAGTDFIDIDALDPSTFSLSMFSPDELFNTGNQYIFYAGYDQTGKKASGNPGFFDYFTQKDENGDYTRPIAANAPVYTAAFIQDNFRINDLLLNVGLRVDRYDANTKVLNDPYSLYAIRSAGDITTLSGSNISHPGNIGNAFAVYVNDMDNPSKIVGYRNGDVWYDAEGVEASNPDLIAQASNSGYITPYLVNPDDEIKSEDFDPSTTFSDFKPVVSVMPRVQFRFRLKEDALFFAHYDVLAERPKGSASGGFMGPANAVSGYEYFYLQEMATNAYVPNPNLKPQKTIDYSVGFMQALKKDVTAITFQAFYREFRDMLQVTTLNYAYPVTYKTYANIDFGTTKGFSVAFDKRKTSKSNISIQADYTMQFASGTGSDLNSQVNLINSDQPNLRTIVPLTFDQRHTLTTQIDYGFDGGSRYNGPDLRIKRKQKNTQTNSNNDDVETSYRYLLEYFSISTIFRMGSGTPFTKQVDPTPEAMFGVSKRSNLDGSINGSYSPFTFKVDVQINKQFPLKFGKKPEGLVAKDNRKTIFLRTFLRIQNLLNAQNIQSVYSYTGTSDDDGYLSSAVGQELVEDQLNPQSFIDMYMIKVNNPTNYSLPRRIMLGLSMNF